MHKLIEYPPKRMFAFGCSYTNYHWPTWANIISYDLGIPLYNYGKIGAGNHYIFNTLNQADAVHHFNSDDLVIVSWSTITREDRFIKNKWVTPGNIYTQDFYNSEFLVKYSDPNGFLIRDLAFFKSASDLLKLRKCQFHFLKLMDFNCLNQWNPAVKEDFDKKILKPYQAYLDKIYPSFVEVLWQNNLGLKFQLDKDKFYDKFEDGHPTVLEHFEFLQKTFDHIFTEKTIYTVFDCDTKITDRINEMQVKGRWHRFVTLIDFFFNKSRESEIYN
jgi:hypothetical protein